MRLSCLQSTCCALGMSCTAAMRSSRPGRAQMSPQDKGCTGRSRRSSCNVPAGTVCKHRCPRPSLHCPCRTPCSPSGPAPRGRSSRSPARRRTSGCTSPCRPACGSRRGTPGTSNYRLRRHGQARTRSSGRQQASATPTMVHGLAGRRLPSSCFPILLHPHLCQPPSGEEEDC